jgi:hypothetical protein
LIERRRQTADRDDVEAVYIYMAAAHIVARQNLNAASGRDASSSR